MHDVLANNPPSTTLEMSTKRIIRLLILLLLLPVSVAAKDFVVVIDPGHGGKDAGALGQRTNEKTVNLGVAKRQ